MSDLNELKEIEGIGEETLADLKRAYNSKAELIEALKTDKVPLRNDIVAKLKEALL